MLIYHPAYDAFHCVFRLLLITDTLREIEAAKLRIIDFYVLYPAEIRKISFPRGKGKIKSLANQLVNRYHGPVNTAQAFKDLEHIQASAIGALVAAGFIEKGPLASHLIKRTGKEVNPELRALIDQLKNPMPSEIEYLLNELSGYPLMGDGGLKQRTGLMEYRYDYA